MKNTLLRILSVAACLMAGQHVIAQVVKGQLVDAESGEPLIGATIVEMGTQNGTVTDIDGNFELKLGNPRSSLLFKYVGYKDKNQKANAKAQGVTNLGTIQIESDSKMLNDVIVSGTIAVSRKTPVAVSSLPSAIIEEKLGSQEFPEVLKSTPGVHANKQGGGYGDSEIYMRGFDNTNVATMINGVPMNDMENGTVYWSNWAGLSDVTATMQTQRGLDASKVSAPSVGGTINIITKGLEAKKGGNISYSMGSNGMNKILFTVSTGITESGWALTVLGAKNWGEGNFQGGNYVGYNYFFSISKKINDQHSISLSAFGAPQDHYQRGTSSGLTIANWRMVEKVYGVRNYRYNSTYGFDKNGQRKDSEHNVYHKPQISLNHQWKINETSNLSTSAYLSIGRGYGITGEANSDFADAYGNTHSYSDFRGSYQGTFYEDRHNADGTFDYAAIQDINETSEHGSLLVLCKNLNYHNWYGLLSTYSTKFGQDIDFYGGIDFRYYNGHHGCEIIDLLGGKYYMDSSTRGAVKAANNYRVNDPSWVYEKLTVGDNVYRDFDSYVVQGGVFFQAEYSKDALSAFVSGALNNTDYWRIDHLNYDKAHEKSDNVNYWGYNIKGGANYNLNEYHNVFANVGFISRAPKFNYGAFMSPNASNVTNKNAKNEKIFSIEAGYGFRYENILDVKVNMYYTNWMDKTMTKSATLGQEQVEAYMNMEGVDARHMGVEIEGKYNPFRWLELTGMLSMGDWIWNSNATGFAYDRQGQPLNINGGIASGVGAKDHARANINLKDVRVGGSAQTTAAVGMNLKLSKALKVGLDWNLMARNYSYYSFSGSNVSFTDDDTKGNKALDIANPWKLPSAQTVDAMASYKFKIGNCNAVFSGNVNNLLNYQYIVKAWNPNSLTTDANASNVYVYFNTGRTYSLRLKVNF